MSKVLAVHRTQRLVHNTIFEYSAGEFTSSGVVSKVSPLAS